MKLGPDTYNTDFACNLYEDQRGKDRPRAEQRNLTEQTDTVWPETGDFQENAKEEAISFSGDIQDPPGQGPVQPALGDPALAGGLD